MEQQVNLGVFRRTLIRSSVADKLARCRADLDNAMHKFLVNIILTSVLRRGTDRAFRSYYQVCVQSLRSVICVRRTMTAGVIFELPPFLQCCPKTLTSHQYRLYDWSDLDFQEPFILQTRDSDSRSEPTFDVYSVLRKGELKVVKIYRDRDASDFSAKLLLLSS